MQHMWGPLRQQEGQDVAWHIAGQEGKELP